MGREIPVVVDRAIHKITWCVVGHIFFTLACDTGDDKKIVRESGMEAGDREKSTG